MRLTAQVQPNKARSKQCSRPTRDSDNLFGVSVLSEKQLEKISLQTPTPGPANQMIHYEVCRQLRSITRRSRSRHATIRHTFDIRKRNGHESANPTTHPTCICIHNAQDEQYASPD